MILGGFVEFWAISAQVRSAQKHASFPGCWVGTEHYLNPVSGPPGGPEEPHVIGPRGGSESSD